MNSQIIQEKVTVYNPITTPQKIVLVKCREIAPETYEAVFRHGKNKIDFKPGQYIHLTIPLAHQDVRGNSRDFSIISSPHEDVLRIAFRNSDSGFKKTLLQKKKLSAEMMGPFGRFTLPSRYERNLIFIAGGIGITPFLSMINYIAHENLPYKIKLLYVNTIKKSAAYLDDLRAIEKKHPNIVLQLYSGRLNIGLVHEEVKSVHNPLIYIAGPPPMVRHMQETLSRMGIYEHDIRTEEFAGYTEDVQAVKTLGEGIEGELAHRSLTDLEALLEALNNSAIVSETDASGAITFVNDKFTEISKYSREELIGQNHRILKSGHHPKAFYDNMWATITRGALWRGQIKNKAKDGSYYWVDTSIAPIFTDGRPGKYISVRFPITERQIAEEQLQERAKQQNVLTALSQEALASTELHTLFDTATNLLAQTLNAEFCLIEKLQPNGKRFVYESGVGWHNVTRGDTSISAGSTESMGGFTLASKEPVILEDLAVESRFAGSAILHDHKVVSGLTVIIHGTEKPFGILGVFTSTKRLFSQEDINFVQAIANILANAARNHLDKRKDEFLGLASHELRTPLTSTKTFVQLLRKHAVRQKDEQSLLFLSKIEKQLYRLTELVGDLLDISRINSGKLEYEDKEFKLSELVKEAVKEYQLTSPDHAIELIDKGHSIVYGDRNRIGQVITNLLANAVKYSPNSNKIIVRTADENDMAQVSVQDFGVGISQDEKPHVFERFFRGNGKKKEDFPGGLGLGLYLSAEIIKRYNGRIWVESEEGTGSTFYFSLPIREY